MDRYLTEKETSVTFNIPRKTLQRWRLTGCGPPFYKPQGSIRYRFSEFEEYLSHHRYRSTSEYRSSSKLDDKQKGV